MINRSEAGKLSRSAYWTMKLIPSLTGCYQNIVQKTGSFKHYGSLPYPLLLDHSGWIHVNDFP
jgi:hypothetical protein